VGSGGFGGDKRSGDGKLGGVGDKRRGLDGVLESVIRDAFPVLLPLESKQGHHKSYDTFPPGRSNITASSPHVSG
tara:strand:- start:328 stop:552 length:225 start_codon:yes stop_codon:yes gene_type:complete